MIDLHCHVLPAMDDGCQSVEESLVLLGRLAKQKVDTVIATPHFHANSESVSDFLARRQVAYDRLTAQMPAGLPQVKLGAEVRYYAGISHMAQLKQLCLQDSNLLLLEMPLGKWTEYTLQELTDLASSSGICLVMAHIERYWKEQPTWVWMRLLQSGILFQVNAPAFLGIYTRRKAFKFLKNHSIHFLGSDSHNVSNRPPRLDEAMAVIRKKMGDDFADHWIGFGESWFA